MDYKSAGSNLGSILGGAAIGAGLMYVFDPKQGAERREYIADTASELTEKAIENTKDAFSSVVETVRDSAGKVGRATKAGTKAFAGTMKERAGDVKDSASRFAGKASNVGQDAADRLRYALRGRRYTAAEKMGLDTGLKQSLGAFGLLCIGVGAMYFLDPTLGSARRRAVGRQFASGFDWLAQGTRSIWSHFRGTSSSMHPQNRQLFESVREDVGRCISKPSLVSVECRNGRVILSGPVLRSEVDGLLRNVWATPGVREVINRLEVHETLSAMPGEQVSEDAPYTAANRI